MGKGGREILALPFFAQGGLCNSDPHEVGLTGAAPWGGGEVLPPRSLDLFARECISLSGDPCPPQQQLL